MHRLEQGPRLHCVRWRRWPSQGPQAGGWQGWEGEGPGSSLKPVHEPDPGGAQWTDPGCGVE